MTYVDTSKLSLRSLYAPNGMKATKGTFGLEIEMEGDGLTGAAIKGWTPHADNSLRGPRGQGPGGMEYTTTGAVSLVDVRSSVEYLQKSLREAGAVLRDDSPRTSTHIHHNVQELPIGDIFGYICVFAAVEPLFLHLCGPRRDGNSFCCPSYDTGDLPDWFHHCLKYLDQYKQGEYCELHQRGKYASLGTFRLHDLGTLEARCFPFSVEPEVIHTWCTWMQHIQDLVSRQEDKSFRSLIKTGLHDPMYLADAIFGADAQQAGRYLAAELIEFGSREAYELTRIMKFFLNKKVDERKKKKSIEESILDDMVEVQVDIAQAPVFRPFENIVPGWGVAAPARVRRPRGFGE